MSKSYIKAMDSIKASDELKQRIKEEAESHRVELDILEAERKEREAIIAAEKAKEEEERIAAEEAKRAAKEAKKAERREKKQTAGKIKWALPMGFAACFVCCTIGAAVALNRPKANEPDFSELGETSDEEPTEGTTQMLETSAPVVLYSDNYKKEKQLKPVIDITQATTQKQEQTSESATEVTTIVDSEINKADMLSAESSFSDASAADAAAQENVQIANPIESVESLDILNKRLGYVAKTPQYLPSGYKTDSIYIYNGKMAEINYTSADNELTYRTENTQDDVSGDYNIYERTENTKIGSDDITFKYNNDKCYLAVWNGHSISSKNGLGKDEMIRIIEGIE